MAIRASEVIDATKEEVWKLVTDNQKAKERIECIIDIKVIERPENGIVGLKWEETRKMFAMNQLKQCELLRPLKKIFWILNRF